jgi:glutamate 5-kinase
MPHLMKRLVIKVGTSTLTTEDGRLDSKFIDCLAEVVAAQRKAGVDVAVVTSGAVGTGVDRLGISRPRTMAGMQAAAAVGQGILMEFYASFFGAHGLVTAQVLLTRQDIADRVRYTNAHNTLDALFRYGAIPVVNENDTVAIEEIRFGDNDTLAAIVGLITDADLVVLLSDIDGLYDPADPERQTIPVVSEVNAGVEAMGRPPESRHGTGGMVTKIRAARVLTRSGIPMLIGPGRDLWTIPGAVERWMAHESNSPDPGRPGTLFLPGPRKLRGRKRWIAYGQRAHGALVVNEMAARAVLDRGSSLLAAGVVDVAGRFEPGELVRVVGQDGKEVGRGLVNFSLSEISAIRGKHSDEIRALLVPDAVDEVIHRDNMVVGV